MILESIVGLVLTIYLNFRQQDIGLEVYNKKTLFIELLKLSIMVFVVIIQLHYCNKEFMKIVAMPTG